MTELTKWLDSRRSPMELIERLFDGNSSAGGIKVEEMVDGNTLVVRAELPGIDPEKDAEITISDGGLTIRAERREETEHKEKDSYRSEFRYGSFARGYPCPKG